MNKPWFNIARESGAISRFHTRNMLYKQSIAEHSYNAIIIALELMNDVEEIDEKRLILYLSLHDLSEASTGDVHGGAKKHNKELKKILDQMEYTWVKDNVPEYLQHAFVLSYKEKLIAKISDLLEALHTALIEVRLGNDVLKSAVNDVWNTLVEKFIEASNFDLTLARNTDKILSWLEKEYEIEMSRSIDYEQCTWEVK